MRNTAFSFLSTLAALALCAVLSGTAAADNASGVPDAGTGGWSGTAYAGTDQGSDDWHGMVPNNWSGTADGWSGTADGWPAGGVLTGGLADAAGAVDTDPLAEDARTAVDSLYSAAETADGLSHTADGLVETTGTAELPPPSSTVELSAPSAILMEKRTGAVLFAKDEHTPREPASVTKIMPLLLTMEAIDSGQLSYDTVVTASAHAASMGGSQIWLREGEQMTVEDMVKAVCVVSANDCAVALGEQLAGSEEAFVGRMNQRAAELGMTDTQFHNATGLPAQGHVTSAADIAIMSRELILRHPDIRRFTTIRLDTLRNGASQLVNTNKLLRTFQGATGLKTGSTDAARYCLSATAERDGMELIAVVLKEETSAKRFADAAALLNWGFANYALVTVTPEEPLPPVPVRLGTRETVQPVLGEAEPVLLDRTRSGSLSQSVTLAEGVTAPVSAGDRLGTLCVYAGDALAAEIPLVAGETVPRLTYGEALGRLLRRALLAG